MAKDLYNEQCVIVGTSLKWNVRQVYDHKYYIIKAFIYDGYCNDY